MSCYDYDVQRPDGYDKNSDYPGAGHSDAWIKAYDDPELYDWFLKQKRK